VTITLVFYQTNEVQALIGYGEDVFNMGSGRESGSKSNSYKID